MSKIWVRTAKDLVGRGEFQTAIGILRENASPKDDVSLQTACGKLAMRIVEQKPDIPQIRIAFLGNVTLNHWVDLLRFWLLLSGVRLESYIAPFGTLIQEALDPESCLHGFNPDYVWLFQHVTDVPILRSAMPGGDVANEVVRDYLHVVSKCVRAITQHGSTSCIVNNIVPYSERIFGNLEASGKVSPAAIVSRVNLELGTVVPPGSVIFDMAHLAMQMGLRDWFDARLWYHSKYPFSLAVHSKVAFVASRVVLAGRGRSRKCIVLDLDNTLWGGVVGDDGVAGIKVGPDDGALGEAFQEFQSWLKGLSDRGIVLAVCSKNEDAIAREAFERKNGMVLRLGDISVFKANWDNKADNIRQIARQLNIGLDSIVFVDDNPVERGLVKSEIPEVAVPDMPIDPSGYIAALASGAWFESLAVTEEDITRAGAYQANARRAEAMESSTDLPAFLKSLGMQANCFTGEGASLKRAAQLLFKTNQFNTTSVKYTETQLAELVKTSDHLVLCCSLKDRYGDFGVISIVVIHLLPDLLTIENWVMSCRVFSRRVEDYIFSKILKFADSRSVSRIEGKFVQTARNGYAADLYRRLGGEQYATDKNVSSWAFDLGSLQTPDDFYIDELESIHEQAG